MTAGSCGAATATAPANGAAARATVSSSPASRCGCCATAIICSASRRCRSARPSHRPTARSGAASARTEAGDVFSRRRRIPEGRTGEVRSAPFTHAARSIISGRCEAVCPSGVRFSQWPEPCRLPRLQAPIKASWHRRCLCDAQDVRPTRATAILLIARGERGVTALVDRLPVILSVIGPGSGPGRSGSDTDRHSAAHSTIADPAHGADPADPADIADADPACMGSGAGTSIGVSRHGRNTQEAGDSGCGERNNRSIRHDGSFLG